MNSISKEEKELTNVLEKQGIDVKQQYPIEGMHVDIAVPEAKVGIEVDGSHHLLDSTQINKDLNRSYVAQKHGYLTLHVPNNEVRNHLPKLAHALATALRNRIRRIKYKRNLK